MSKDERIWDIVQQLMVLMVGLLTDAWRRTYYLSHILYAKGMYYGFYVAQKFFRAYTST